MSVFDRALERAARFLDDVLLLPDPIRLELEEAEKELAAGHHAEAARTFQLLLGARPNLMRAQIGYARALAAGGDVVQARVILAQARDLSPDDPALTLLAARLSLDAGDVGGAITLAREAARRLAESGGPLLAEACVLRARAERSRGRPDRAARELKKAVAAAPDEGEYRIALAEALADAGDVAAALRAARVVPESALGSTGAARLALALRSAGDSRSLHDLLERAARAGDTRALTALAEDALASGDPTQAEAHARMAIARGGGASALETLAHVLAGGGKFAEAAHALLAASADGDLALEERAARTVPLEDAAEVTAFADRLAGRTSGPLAQAIRAHALLLTGEIEAAAEVLSALPPEALRAEPRAALARARLQLAQAKAADALTTLDELLAGEPLRAADAALAGKLRHAALERLYRGEEGELDLPAAIDRVLAMAEAEQLPELVAGAQKLRDELDRPLLLAILGEFNAGKSTLVNAFVGAEVAPTGILPTTATLNVLRGGAERRVRVVRKDGTTREGGYDDVGSLLATAAGEGHVVDHVEIVLPSELLERVWILDTPGSNAPDPDHERLAQEAMRRADAALWIFDAGQAGKATEGSVLAGVRRSRREVVAALNKIDRLKDGELAIVNQALRGSMPELTHDAIGVSARAAVKARLAGDDAALEASGFPALMAHLEAQVFSRSRALKRRACGGRLLALIEEALAREPDACAQLRADGSKAREDAKALRALERAVTDDVEGAITQLESEQAAAFHDAAREVLAFVRPRANRFSAHGADPEDRAFLRETMEVRLEGGGESAAALLLQAIAKRLDGALAPSAERRVGLELRARAAIAPPIAAFAGYQAGLLAGGELRRFFDDVLPRIELSLAPITEALAQSRAHPREALKPALENALAGLLRSLSREAEERARDQERREAELVARRYEPLRVLHQVLSALAD